MKTVSGDKLIGTPYTCSAEDRLKFYVSNLKGKILVDEAELRRKCASCSDDKFCTPLKCPMRLTPKELLKDE